jgi:polysaccharide export outer membrane protein
MRVIVFAALLWSLSVSAATAQSPELSTYKLGPGDVISIRVLGEDELRRERVRLSDAGTVSFPVLGEIKVKGLTAGALEQRVTQGLKGRYLLNPQVTVTIEEYRNFFLNGMVEKPGSYPYSPGLTVLKAVALAGGFKERANRGRINVIHDDDASHTARRIDLNAAVMPGDIITVEESFF